jgi:hypothetical protein
MSAFVPPEPAAAPPPSEPTLRDYNFQVVCASGELKDFSFKATDFLAARTQLATLIESN